MRLLTINAVLNHAEEKQVDDENVKDWLDEVNFSVYDAEDLLEEIAFDAIESKNGMNLVRNSIYNALHLSDSTKESIDFKISDTIDTLNPLAVHSESKLKSMIGRLDDIVKQKDVLNLREDVGGKLVIYDRPPTTPLVNRFDHVYGRKNDEEKILELLTHEESTDDRFLVIPIVGMGGIGKTTLARIVFNHKKTIGLFNLKAWACVSDEFDVMKITKTLVESATKNTCDLNNLELLQEKLVEKLEGKKFLIVLDDVWNEKPGLWDVLQVPFGVGAPGSCVIVTTRNESVASIMGTVPFYHLRELSEDDSLSLLEDVAFPNKNSHAYPGLKKIGKEIAMKCKGLPLAARALGGLIRSKLDEGHWNDILYSNMWDNLNADILPALRLSYHYLPAPLKKCFAYCSMFPKDHEFEMEKLVFLWMAEGFVQEPEGNQMIEDVGRNYFNGLLSRSFFQQCSDDGSRFLMHDLIHDLAQYVFGKICLTLEDRNEVIKQYNVPAKVRHLSFIRGSDVTFVKLKSISNAKCLRTFLPLDRSLGFRRYGISRTESSIGEFKDLMHLKGSLSISGLQRSKINEAIEAKLEVKEHLEELTLEWTSRFDDSRIGTMEEEVLDALEPHKNLKKLVIKDYGGKKFPGWFSDPSFKKMTSIHLYGCKRCKALPSFGQLPSLKDLIINGMDSLEVVGSEIFGDDYFPSLETLKFENLKEWKEWLSFEREAEGFAKLRVLTSCEELSTFSKPPSIPEGASGSLPEYSEAINFLNLRVLILVGCSNLNELPTSLPSLEVLKIDGCNKLAGLLMLSHLRNLVLMDCDAKLLGCLVELHSLRSLEIQNISKFTFLTPGFIQQSSKLEELKIFHCKDLEVLTNWQIGLVRLMSLKRLTILQCPKLTDLPEGKKLPPILEYLDLRHCHNLKQLPSDLCNLKSLTEFRVEECKMLKSFPHRALPGTLKRLVVQGCDALMTIPMELVGNNSALEYLEIGRCSSLESFLEQCEFPTTLIHIRINNCKKLKLLPHGIMSENTKLEYFEVDNCPALESFPAGQLPMTLRRLQIGNCNIGSLPANLLSLRNLEQLQVSGCPILEYFPSGAWRSLSLRQVEIKECENLKSLPDGIYNLTNLKELSVGYCPNLVSIKKQGFPVSLRLLDIRECGNISSLDGWKLHKLKSLNFFALRGFPGFVSFSTVYLLNQSITELRLIDLPDLESLSEALEVLTLLETLMILQCKKLKALPDSVENTSSIELIVYAAKSCQDSRI
ncbi:unnamed protein product [Fraxinus pennsylvanica]|uniref:Disease resistance RPP13-like protein 1 n=1 Tax=Fraxinus pennsylvanica TaxID=56036 RepID=A0AAD2E940_9LAMI|nr:unnamed protein product [Fraxinus pennsylvanica]